MARSHPPTLLTLARSALKRTVAPHDTIVAAVSGGPDSMAMLHVLATLAHERSFVVIAHGVDHGLRPEAGEELALAASLAQSLHVQFTRTELSLDRGGNLQARARAARLEALERVRLAAGARFIATAHHADDRAETVLLRLLRGSSLRGLGVLPLVDGPRLRPLIEARRRDIDAHLARHSIAFARDPSNANPRYLRTRVRQDVLPLLASMNPRIVARLTSLADEALLLPDEAVLPRATREALRRLDSGRASKKMRVTLPGGLVISGAQTNDSGVALAQGRGLNRESDRAVQSLAGTVESGQGSVGPNVGGMR